MEEINKGWSGDKKYRVIGEGGEPQFLRISPIERYEARKALFERLHDVYALGIPMARPLEFGRCDEGVGVGVYILESWAEGEELGGVAAGSASDLAAQSRSGVGGI